MSSAADRLDTMAKARAQLRAAEQEEAEARKVLRAATEKLKAADKRYRQAIDEALDENRQPSLFDQIEPAAVVPAPPVLDNQARIARQQQVFGGEPEPEVPTWHKLLLRDSGWDEEWSADAWDAIYNRAKVRTAGELAQLLLGGERFALDLHELQGAFAAIEMISESDEHPIKFGKAEPIAPAASLVVKGEPIEPLGLTAAELDKAVCPGKIGRVGDKPKALPVVTVSGRPHVVVAGSYPAASSGRPTAWKVRPIWTEKEFPSRYTGELSKSVQQSDIYLGVKVLVGKGKSATVHVVGPKHEERQLIEFAGERKPAPQKPTVPQESPVPTDETEAWLRRAVAGAPGTGQDPKRLKRQIAEFRDDQAANNAHPMWSHWSEFFVLLLTGGKDTGDRVRVLSKPDWNGEKGRHHIEFWHSRISETGYWSIVTAKAGPMLVEWCREHIQKQADEYQAERTAKKPAKQPSLVEAAAGTGIAPEQVAAVDPAELQSGSPPVLPRKPVVILSEVPNFPDAVFDALFVKGISSLATLLERVDEATAGIDLPVRNRVVTFLVKQGIKLKPAENAADAITAHIAAGDKPPVKIIDVLNLPKPKRVRKPKAVTQ